MKTYKILRFRPDCVKVIRRGLTLEEAQAHCSREDTHKTTKNGHVLWFDGYTEE